MEGKDLPVSDSVAATPSASRQPSHQALLTAQDLDIIMNSSELSNKLLNDTMEGLGDSGDSEEDSEDEDMPIIGFHPRHNLRAANVEGDAAEDVEQDGDVPDEELAEHTGVGVGHSLSNLTPYHTYMEIETEADPVYEEIERERWAGRSAGLGAPVGQEAMQVSDLSDEDMKRGTPSDMSRQSSRCYGDARPLLPYHHSPAHHFPKSPQDQHFSLSEERLQDFNAAQMSRDMEQLQQAHHQFSRDNLMTVAVLNGEQVVCRLSSPTTSQAPQSLPVIHEGATRGIMVSQAGQPATNGFPAHVVVSRPPHYKPHQFSEC